MIRLHHVPQSRSMRSLWLLHELGIEFDCIVHPFDKSLRKPDYLALSPAGRVPALEIGDAVLFETGAITEYLCECFPDAGLWRAPGDQERAEWLVWVHFAETISQHAAALTQQHLMLYDDAMRSPIVMKLEAARIGKCYAALEDRLEGRDYLLDGGFSAADISVGQAVYMARHFAKTDEFTRVSEWIERLSARDAFQKSLPQTGEATLYSQEFYPAWELAP